MDERPKGRDTIRFASEREKHKSLTKLNSGSPILCAVFVIDRGPAGNRYCRAPGIDQAELHTTPLHSTSRSRSCSHLHAQLLLSTQESGVPSPPALSQLCLRPGPRLICMVAECARSFALARFPSRAPRRDTKGDTTTTTTTCLPRQSGRT